jgi:hypothetical protein
MPALRGFWRRGPAPGAPRSPCCSGDVHCSQALVAAQAALRERTQCSSDARTAALQEELATAYSALRARDAALAEAEARARQLEEASRAGLHSSSQQRWSRHTPRLHESRSSFGSDHREHRVSCNAGLLRPREEHAAAGSSVTWLPGGEQALCAGVGSDVAGRACEEGCGAAGACDCSHSSSSMSCDAGGRTAVLQAALLKAQGMVCTLRGQLAGKVAEADTLRAALLAVHTGERARDVGRGGESCSSGPCRGLTTQAHTALQEIVVEKAGEVSALRGCASWTTLASARRRKKCHAVQAAVPLWARLALSTIPCMCMLPHHLPALFVFPMCLDCQAACTVRRQDGPGGNRTGPACLCGARVRLGGIQWTCAARVGPEDLWTPLCKARSSHESAQLP